MRNSSLRFLRLLAAGVLSAAAAADAQTYPDKPIRMIASSGTGGSGDIMTRIAADLLSKRLGVPVTVENMPGAGSTIGSGFVARAAGDGYTLLHSSDQGLNILPSAIKYNFDPDTSLMPVAMLAEATSCIVVRAGDMNTLAEFVARAKANPGKLTYASSGPGSATHFAGELFRLRAGINLLAVPFKASTQSMAAAVGGQVDMIILGTIATQSLMQAGKLKPLACMSERRASILPEVPTIAELGYPDALFVAFYGVFAPGTTAEPIARRLARELGEVGKSPEYKRDVDKLGSEASVKLLDEFRDHVRKQRTLWHGVARDANMKFE